MRGEARREEVVDLLWRGVEEDKAKNAFRQALHRLRGALGDELVPQDRERIRLVRSERITIDLDEFDAAVRGGRLDSALSAYTGDFLEGASLGEATFEHWAEQERTRLRVALRQVLQDAVTAAGASGDWSRAVAYSKRLMIAAPFEGAAAHLAATTMISAGRRVEAQELIRQFEARLDTELGLPLPAELQALTSRIDRQDRQVTPRSTTSSELSLPFVGRESELSQLMTLWRTTTADAGAFVLIQGEPGIGKTRLLRELVAHARALGPVLVLNGSERVSGAQLPYGLFAESLRPLVRAKGILGTSRHLLAEAARLLPELRDEIDLPSVSDVEDEVGRLRLFEGLSALIDAAAFEQPVLLVLEDLHAIPPSSLDLLSYLAVRLARSPVMFVLTIRADLAPPAVLQRLRALALASANGTPPHGARALAMALGPLSQSALMQASAAAPAIGVSGSQLQRAVTRAGGIPGRLAELLRRFAANEEVALPPLTMRDLLRERVERLPSAPKRALLSLALIGRPVEVKTLAAAAHLPHQAAREAVQLLAELSLLECRDDEVSMTDTTARAVLESAGPGGRSFLAGWVADALSQDPRVNPGDLARLYASAGDSPRAFSHSRRAALSALAVGAPQEAVLYLTSARTFATDPNESREIESLLAALGSGRKRLSVASSPETAAQPPKAEVATDQRPLWLALFPNWRLLLGGAIASLAISAAVLAARPEPLLVSSRGIQSDTLIVTEGEANRVRFVTVTDAGDYQLSDHAVARASVPPWIDSLSRPWIDPLAAPRGRGVAVARVTPRGSDVYVISASRQDTVVVVSNDGDARPLGWSPDGRYLLAASAHGLRAISIFGPPRVVVIDTSSQHVVSEAAWSPDGSRIAWVANVVPRRQFEVFASQADGSELQNVSRNSADDSHIAWSWDGQLLAFTSMRDGNAEIYAHSFLDSHDWRLTNDPAQDDRAAFSRSGHLVAFESTRGGTPGVYVMPSLGGEARRVRGDASLTIDTWESGPARYVDRVRIIPGPSVGPGDTTSARLVAYDQFGDAISASESRWLVLDSSVARVVSSPVPASVRLVAGRDGLAGVIAEIGQWRSDTAYIRIGNRPMTLLELDAHLREWTPLGVPSPSVRAVDNSVVVTLNADREWESGILSRTAVPLIAGLSVQTRIDAPFTGSTDPAMTLGLALVAPEDAAAIDVAAPQWLRLASFSWNAESKRFVYSVGREVFTENVRSTSDHVDIDMRVEGDSTVSFAIDGRPRWRSTLRLLGARQVGRAKVWLGGRTTGDLVKVSRLHVSLDSVRADVGSARR